MTPTVHILATVRNPDLVDAALLVFRTLRAGFPTSQVQVWGNSLSRAHENILLSAAQSVNGGFQNIAATSHDAWLESLILESTEPFWVCDTDVSFWGSFERPEFNPRQVNGFAGRREPAFNEEWTRTIHVERLHTCLMYVVPQAVRVAMRQFMARVPEIPFGKTADFALVGQHFIPLRGGEPLFYDTMAGLWHAGYGTPFTEEQNDLFDHLNCATYADLIGPHLSVPNLAEQHRHAYRNFLLMRGARHAQAKYYERQQPKEHHALRTGS